MVRLGRLDISKIVFNIKFIGAFARLGLYIIDFKINLFEIWFYAHLQNTDILIILLILLINTLRKHFDLN